MSVVYETGTALHANDLLDRLRVFAAANGWTVQRWAVRSDGLGSGGWALNLQRGDLHAGLYADLGAGTLGNPGQYVGGFLYPAWDAGLGNMAQANRSQLSFTNGLGSTQYTGYHFFAGAEYLHAVVEVVDGEFRHFGTGRLRRFGAVTTGGYVVNSFWSYAPAHRASPFSTPAHAVPWDSFDNGTGAPSVLLRADSDAVSPRYLLSAHANVNEVRCGMRGQAPPRPDTLPAQQAQASTLTGRAVLWPILTAAARSGGLFSPLGQPPDVRFVRLDHLQPKDLLTIGTEQWMVFPVIRRDGGIGQPSSLRLGLAYRRA